MPPIRSNLIAALCLLLWMSGTVAAQPTAPPAAGSSVVASQGGATVTLADIDAFAQRIPVDKRPGFFNSPTRIEGVITNLLLQKQLAAEARKAGIKPDPKPQGAEGADVSDEAALAKARMERFRADLKIPDLGELAQEEYVAHKEDYVVPGKLTVRHVLISTRSRSEADARTLADTVEQEAKAHPDRFDALIEKYSDDPAKATSHGVLEQVGEKGKYVAAFVRAAKALAKPGDISPVVGTPFALHVIQLVERTPDRQQSFDEVKDDILKRLASRLVDKAVREHADALRNLPMNADPALVASLRTRYGAVAPVPGEQPKAAAGK